MSNYAKFTTLDNISKNLDHKRRPVTKSARESGIYPYYGASGIIDYVDDYIFDGEYLLVSEDGANLIARTTPIAFSISGKTWVNNHAHILEFKSYAERRFVEFYLNSIDLSLFISGGAQPKLNQANLNKIPIPAVPVEKQEEIVRILDTFTELEAELEAELVARKQQYCHYRDSLLKFDKNKVKHLPMGEVGTFIRGNGLQKKDFTEDGVGCIHYGQIYTHYGTYTDRTKSFVSNKLASTLKEVETGDIVIAVTSENIEDVCKCVAWLGEKTIVTGGHAMIFKHKENPKYIAYYLQTQAFSSEKRRYARGAKVIDISKADIEKIIIPVPPIEEQERIVAILDKFDALVNDISVGLPAELNARRQQYEHYRDKLLTFKEAEK